ncbi:hypothetical protein M8756_02530 [Lutimaribacter sp. EGI FJ00015]|uniref:Uncharacterized protein n=1 Tax=Lutimaribacter degradans TaxID=2945989 RepID=A0ACC5ZRD9_9RHOB|nr:hypothetical protein [Lutimaribacter sp. EGI FJ00013]MCM2560884.1 hypothetical protein [Lutimaribacter sp. EGI FJ00013]MCO0612171.1 hypothetical protein [Lutimaribacter sp. EGI FJ00015]MCO0634709.1 hypothetical protein [Lutimaribacter sp. EGI FJ00014]
MPLQNRVLPTGQIVAHPARGTMMGNRGILHDDARRLGPARWRHPHWICCVLSFKGRHRQIMHPKRYTELFFLDEAVALAAGHRPCAECRRADYTRFRKLWEQAHGPVATAAALDRALHRARVTRDRQQVRHHAAARDVPAGSFIAVNDQPHLVVSDCIFPFTLDGYGSPFILPKGMTTVLTPAPLVAVLRLGYAPQLHPSTR